MSARIEHADPLALLRELPSGWAQSCITSPPIDDLPAQTLAVLGEVRRVLRHDGTLWLLCQRKQPLLAALCDQDWRPQPTPEWSRQLAPRWGASSVLLLLSKERRYFHEQLAPAPPGPAVCVSRQRRRAEGCLCGREQHVALLRRCILAGSAPLACGICGAPFGRARPRSPATGTRQPTCGHNDPAGRCLLLDPFCSPAAATAELAQRHGRSFLGITSGADRSVSR